MVKITTWTKKIIYHLKNRKIQNYDMKFPIKNNFLLILTNLSIFQKRHKKNLGEDVEDLLPAVDQSYKDL